MAHHAEYLPVRILADIGPFWDDPADEFMVVLTGAFLPGSGGVAVKDMGTPVCGKVILQPHGKEFFTWYSKHLFTLHGKHFFT